MWKYDPPNLNVCLPLTQVRLPDSWYTFCGPPTSRPLDRHAPGRYPGKVILSPVPVSPVRKRLYCQQGAEPGAVPNGSSGCTRLYEKRNSLKRLGEKLCVRETTKFWFLAVDGVLNPSYGLMLPAPTGLSVFTYAK